MKDDQKKEAKKRIFETAVKLIACKGYSAVGIREIAKAAGVQISMINYYYEGKIGILKAIMDECYTKYFAATIAAMDEGASLEERVRTYVCSLIKFYRENADLASAAFGAIPVDIPEIIDYRIKWFESTREKTDKLFRILGLDPNDVVHTAVLKGFLGNIIGTFFRSRYCCERIAKETTLSEHVREHFKHDDHSIPLDDAFFEKYAALLTKVYLHGITSIRKK